MMLDTLATALRYKAAGFTDAQAEALVERDRMVETLGEASSRPRAKAHRQSILANHWRLWFAVATIGIVGSCDAILYLALQH